MMRTLKIIALLLPVIIPAFMAGKIVIERSTAPTYMVRIEGYDPRDMLYGHYLRFRFVPEKSKDADTFPDDLAERVTKLEGKYFIPEDEAYTLENLLRQQDRVMEIEVGLPSVGKPFMGDLYIDGKPMKEFLREFKNRVDLNGNTEGQ